MSLMHDVKQYDITLESTISNCHAKKFHVVEQYSKKLGKRIKKFEMRGAGKTFDPCQQAILATYPDTSQSNLDKFLVMELIGVDLTILGTLGF